MSQSFGLSLLAAPAAEPISLAEAKLYLRIDHSLEDALILSLITTARALAESYLKRSLITQSWELVLEEYVSGRVRLPMSPVLSISEVAMLFKGGITTLIPPTGYYLMAGNEAINLESPLIAHQIRIRYVAGYGDGSSVPAPIALGLRAHLTALYEARGEMVAIPDQAIALYQPYRAVSL